MIENQPNEVTLIYHSDKHEDKKTRAYIDGLDGYVIKTLDLKREQLTETQLAEIADKLEGPIHDLVDTQYLDRVKISSVEGMRTEDILKLIANNPVLLHTPIVIIGKFAYQFSSGYQLIRDGAEIVGVQSNPAANVEERKNF